MPRWAQLVLGAGFKPVGELCSQPFDSAFVVSYFFSTLYFTFFHLQHMLLFISFMFVRSIQKTSKRKDFTCILIMLVMYKKFTLYWFSFDFYIGRKRRKKGRDITKKKKISNFFTWYHSRKLTFSFFIILIIEAINIQTIKLFLSQPLNDITDCNKEVQQAACKDIVT